MPILECPTQPDRAGRSLARPATAALRGVIAILCAGLLVAGCSDDTTDAPRHATVLPEPLPLPEFTLSDQDGEPFTRDSLRGRTSLLFFGFTYCPDICPATLQQLALAGRQLADREQAVPSIVMVSVDPERDTVPQLRRYVGHFRGDVTGVTGSRAELEKLTKSLGIFFEKVPDGEDYTVSHSTAVLVIGPGAELIALFSSPHRTDELVHDLPLVMAAQ